MGIGVFARVLVAFTMAATLSLTVGLSVYLDNSRDRELGKAELMTRAERKIDRLLYEPPTIVTSMLVTTFIAMVILGFLATYEVLARFSEHCGRSLAQKMLPNSRWSGP